MSLEWVDRAACADMDTAVFFPSDHRRTLEVLEAAKRVCAGCPVVVDCLEYALESRQEHGVWGGADEAERDRILRARGKGPSKLCGCGRLFVPYRSNVKYCGDECRRAGHAAQQAAWEKARRPGRVYA